MDDHDVDQSELIDDLHAMSARQFLRWFSTPAHSGFYFSPADIQRLGARIGVPVTPFNRSMAVEQFLRGAALDDRLDLALSTLEAEMRAQLAAYRELDIEAMSGWISRAELTLMAWASIARTFLQSANQD